MTPSESLASLLKEHLPYLQSISEDKAAQSPAADIWSAKKLLGHLTDSACNNQVRFIRAAKQSGLEFTGYDQHAWIELGGWQERPWQEIVAIWHAYQLHLVGVLSRIEGSFGNSLSVGSQKEVSLGFIAEDYVKHQLHHLLQIKERASA